MPLPKFLKWICVLLGGLVADSLRILKATVINEKADS
jgi:hypothetical protein